jgi:hypothetical protein
MICLSSLSIRDNFMRLRLFGKDKLYRLESGKHAPTMSFLAVSMRRRKSVFEITLEMFPAYGIIPL